MYASTVWPIFENSSGERCARILEPKRHDSVPVDSVWCYERHFLHIVGIHHNLVIAAVGIKKAQPSMSSRGFHQLVDLWQGKPVFGTGVIQVDVVNANPLLFVLFLHHDGI